MSELALTDESDAKPRSSVRKPGRKHADPANQKQLRSSQVPKISTASLPEALDRPIVWHWS
eukprot:500346-Alexandrium_andersonii.AAC.1